MANKTKKPYVKKRKTLPLEKSKILEKMCDKEQLSVIRKLIKKGCVFIVLGSEHAHVSEFYKGLMQEMYSPTSNGASVYDTYYKFKNAYDRVYITISILDPGNITVVDSIKQLRADRTKTLYTYHYEEV